MHDDWLAGGSKHEFLTHFAILHWLSVEIEQTHINRTLQITKDYLYVSPLALRGRRAMFSLPSS
jgi:hypothetical protein